MSTSRYANWRADLDASRDLSDLDKQSYGFVLGWLESWRLRKGLRAERPAAVLFWKEQVVLDVRLRQTKPREPVVLTREELMGLLDRLDGQQRLAAELQYGGGLRLSEAVRLRVKDIDLAREQITVRSGKGPSPLRYAGAGPSPLSYAGAGPSPLSYAVAGPSPLSYAVASKDRVTVLPGSQREEIAKQVELARKVWRGDRAAGLAGVWLPGALARKFRRAAESFEWHVAKGVNGLGVRSPLDGMTG